MSTINGSAGNASTSVVAGSDVTITIFNNDSNTGQSVSGPGIPGGSFLTRDGKGVEVPPLNPQQLFPLGVVTSPITITFTPILGNYNSGSVDNYCPLGSSVTPSSLTINTVDAPKPVSSPSASSTPSTTQTKPTTTTTKPTTNTATEKDNKQPIKTTQIEPELTAPQSQVVETKTPLYVWVGGAVGLIATIALIIASVMGKVPYQVMFNRLRHPLKK